VVALSANVLVFDLANADWKHRHHLCTALQRQEVSTAAFIVPLRLVLIRAIAAHSHPVPLGRLYFKVLRPKGRKTGIFQHGCFVRVGTCLSEPQIDKWQMLGPVIL
jgi:hypothetical protein